VNSDTGTIVVSRPAGGYRDLLRRYRIEVDGVEQGTVKRGEQLTTSAACGARRVRARIDWTGSPDVEVQVPPEATVTLVVTNRGNAFGRRSYLYLSVEPASPRE